MLLPTDTMLQVGGVQLLSLDDDTDDDNDGASECDQLV
jgi:hypothetical protein